MNQTYIVDNVSGLTCYQNYVGTCIILSTNQPTFGCGAIYARIWQAGITSCKYGTKLSPDIRLITEL